MPHTFTPEPTKKAVDTGIFRPLKDGLLIDWNDQFKLRVVHAPVTGEIKWLKKSSQIHYL